MILLLLAQLAAQESTSQELAFCSRPENAQPYRFCLADRKHERAARNLADALAVARRAASAQQREIERFSRANGGVTISGNPIRALDAAQRAWTQSYKADCTVLGLADATGNAGTEGVTTNWDCEADRMFDRARFLRDAYSTGG